MLSLIEINMTRHDLLFRFPCIDFCYIKASHDYYLILQSSLVFICISIPSMTHQLINNFSLGNHLIRIIRHIYYQFIAIFLTALYDNSYFINRIMRAQLAFLMILYVLTSTKWILLSVFCLNTMFICYCKQRNLKDFSRMPFPVRQYKFFSHMSMF